MVIWIPTFILTALPQCWQPAPIMSSQHNEWCHKITSFPVQKFSWLSISFKMPSQNGEIIKNNANVTWKKHDIQKFRDCIRSTSEKQDSENKQKFAFLLISANKDSLCSVIQTYFSWNSNYLSIILWSFSNIPPLEAKS